MCLPGTNWGFAIVAPAIGSVTFGAIYGKIYDAKVPLGCTDCFEGTDCYKDVFAVSSVALVVGLLTNGALAWRTRKGPPSQSV
jgi:hypothetical protein